MEVRGQGMKIDYLTDFAKGIICGFVAALIICGCIGLVIHSRNKDKEKIEYAEKQIEIEACGKILSIVILLSFLKFPMFAEQQTEQQPNLTESEMRFWSDTEVDLLIDDISEAAYEAIEQAAAEAARAAALAALEREAAAIREAQRWRLEAELRQQIIAETKKAGVKNAVITGLACLLGGLFIGIGGTLIIGGR